MRLFPHHQQGRPLQLRCCRGRNSIGAGARICRSASGAIRARRSTATAGAWTGSKPISTRYRFGEDGIAGISDDQGERQFAWAFWDGKAGPITERLNGATNPAGEYGETVYEDRLFKEATPTHSYLRYIYRYPYQSPQFEIELVTAKVDSRSLIAQAAIKRLGDGGAARLCPAAQSVVSHRRRSHAI